MTAALAKDMPPGSAGAEIAQLRAERDIARTEAAQLRVRLREVTGYLRDLQRVVGGERLEEMLRKAGG